MSTLMLVTTLCCGQMGGGNYGDNSNKWDFWGTRPYRPQVVYVTPPEIAREIARKQAIENDIESIRMRWKIQDEYNARLKEDSYKVHLKKRIEAIKEVRVLEDEYFKLMGRKP